jgi:sugar/nucleoside kinase (ribokinase family)
LTGVKPYQETKIFSQIGARLSLAPEQIVVITKGKGGATAFDGKFVYQVEAPLVEVIDATGAGDSFGSGLVAGLIQNRGRSDLPRALRLAMANAVSNIQVFGANKGLLKIHDKLPEIKITQTVL